MTYSVDQKGGVIPEANPGGVATSSAEQGDGVMAIAILGALIASSEGQRDRKTSTAKQRGI